MLCFEPCKQKGLSATWLGPYIIKKRLGDLTYLLDVGHAKTLRRHRNALKVYQPDNINVSTVVMAQPDDEATDQLTLGPAAEEPHQTDLIKDVRGTSALTLEQTNQLHCLINSFSSIFSDTPGQALLPHYDLDTGQAPPVNRKPYRPALH